MHYFCWSCIQLWVEIMYAFPCIDFTEHAVNTNYHSSIITAHSNLKNDIGIWPGGQARVSEEVVSTCPEWCESSSLSCPDLFSLTLSGLDIYLTSVVWTCHTL